MVITLSLSRVNYQVAVFIGNLMKVFNLVRRTLIKHFYKLFSSLKQFLAYFDKQFVLIFVEMWNSQLLVVNGNLRNDLKTTSAQKSMDLWLTKYNSPALKQNILYLLSIFRTARGRSSIVNSCFIPVRQERISYCLSWEAAASSKDCHERQRANFAKRYLHSAAYEYDMICFDKTTVNVCLNA